MGDGGRGSGKRKRGKEDEGRVGRERGKGEGFGDAAWLALKVGVKECRWTLEPGKGKECLLPWSLQVCSSADALILAQWILLTAGQARPLGSSMLSSLFPKPCAHLSQQSPC